MPAAGGAGFGCGAVVAAGGACTATQFGVGARDGGGRQDLLRLELRLDMQDARKEPVGEREREHDDAGGAAERVLLACDFGTGHRVRMTRSPHRRAATG